MDSPLASYGISQTIRMLCAITVSHIRRQVRGPVRLPSTYLGWQPICVRSTLLATYSFCTDNTIGTNGFSSSSGPDRSLVSRSVTEPSGPSATSLTACDRLSRFTR